MSTEESVGLLSNTYISFPRVSFENECVSDTYAWHVTKKAPWHTSCYGAVYVGIVQAVLNSTVSLKHKRYRHVSSRWRRNVRVRRASYKVRVRCNIVRPNTAVQRGNAWLLHVPMTFAPTVSAVVQAMRWRTLKNRRMTSKTHWEKKNYVIRLGLVSD